MEKKQSKKTREKAWAQSILEASRALGVTRQTLHKWVLIEGSPGKNGAGRFDLRAWRHWMRLNKEDLIARKADDSPAPLTRAQQLKIEILESDLRERQRKEREADNLTMPTADVDSYVFEILANLDFHLSNAEREIALKTARAFKQSALDARKIVKPCFDVFRDAWKDHPLSAEVKRHINEWLALPDKVRAKILAGKYPRKQSK